MATALSIQAISNKTNSKSKLHSSFTIQTKLQPTMKPAWSSLRLKILVLRFLEDKDSETSLNVGADMRKINYCFKYLREMYNQMVKSKQQSANSNSKPVQQSVTIVDASHYDSKEMRELKDTLKQRDNEISK